MELKLKNIVVKKVKNPETFLDALISFNHLTLVSVKQGNVSFTINSTRHLFFYSELTETWKYIHTSYPSRRAISIFKQMLQLGLVQIDGTVSIERKL